MEAPKALKKMLPTRDILEHPMKQYSTAHAKQAKPALQNV
jgi:hypothetical protein